MTYFQVPMQKRWALNEQLVKAKPYARYFTKDLVLPVDMVEGVKAGPLPKHLVIPPTVEGLRTVLTNFEKHPVSGYALIEEGPLAYAQTVTCFPG